MDRTEMMQAILRANAQYAAGQAGQAGIEGACVVVTCMDPRLNRHLPGSLGLKQEQCFLVRNAGATITPQDNSVLRSCALAAAMDDAKCIIVLGHLGCPTACTVMDLTTTLEQVGVPRAALDADLRGWFGLIDEPSHAVRRTAEEIARHPAVRKDLPVLGLIINTNDGKLREVISTVTSGPSAGLQGRLGSMTWQRGDIGSTVPSASAPPPSPAKPEPAKVEFVVPIPVVEPPEVHQSPASPKPPQAKPIPPKRPPPPPPRRPVGAVDEAAEALNRVAKDIQTRLRQQRKP